MLNIPTISYSFISFPCCINAPVDSVEAGEMSQWLRALDDMPGVPGLISRTHMAAHSSL